MTRPARVPQRTLGLLPRVLPCLLALLLAGAPARAQVDSTTWEDPTLAEAVLDADLIVLAEAAAVAKNGAAYRVLRTLKGPKRDGALLAIRGLHHPELRERPALERGDQSYLLLRGKPEGEGFSLPTPTLGRFPTRLGGDGQPEVVMSFGGAETYVRLALPEQQFLRLLGGLIPGEGIRAQRKEASAAARAALAQPGEDPEATYVALRTLGLFAERGDRDLVPLVLRVLAHEELRKRSLFQVRVAAARVLGKLSGKVCAQRLLALAQHDPHPAVRSVAASQLAGVLDGKAGSKAALHIARVLAQASRDASARPVTFADVEDPRTNQLDSPLEANLRALAGLQSREGVKVALDALESEDLDAIKAGLAYFAELKDPRLASAVATRMRGDKSGDAWVNSIFAEALETMTGQKLGPKREPWLAWAREQAREQRKKD